MGGVMRDLLLGRPAKDYDLVVRGVPLAKLQKTLERLGKVNLVGRAFGVLKFTPAKSTLTIDIALPRTEHAIAHSGAYRDFAVQSDYRLPIADDLSRRDFTINALAYNLLTGELIDLFGGRADLKKKMIRTVGAPADRFAEDYSRMLRALRFAIQLDFKLAPKTWSAVRQLASRINHGVNGEYIVPRETVAKEFLKSMTVNPILTLKLYDRSGLLALLLPELVAMQRCPQPKNFHAEGNVWKHTLLCLTNLTSQAFIKEFGAPASTNLLLATLFHDIGKPMTLRTPAQHGTNRIRFDGHDTIGAQATEVICERLKLTAYKEDSINCQADQVVWLVRRHLLIVGGPTVIRQLKPTTLEKYFFTHPAGADLQRLIFVDASSTMHGTPKRPDMSWYRLLKKRLAGLHALRRHRPILPPPLLDGNTIMRLTKLSAGPRVGALLEQLRNAQLRGKIRTAAQAKAYLKTLRS